MLSLILKLTSKIDKRISTNQLVLENLFENLQNEFRKEVDNQNLNKALTSGSKYILIANTIADENEIKLLQSNLEIGYLTINKLKTLHKSIFPQGYEFAGQIRRQMVWIGGTGNLIESHYNPPPAKQVPKLLSNLLSWWNIKYDEIYLGSDKEKIRAISEFHHKLLSIHPFLDGNGRLARILLQMQIKWLYKKTIKIELGSKNYYIALHKADRGNISALESMIKDKVKLR